MKYICIHVNNLSTNMYNIVLPNIILIIFGIFWVGYPFCIVNICLKKKSKKKSMYYLIIKYILL